MMSKINTPGAAALMFGYYLHDGQVNDAYQDALRVALIADGHDVDVRDPAQLDEVFAGYLWADLYRHSAILPRLPNVEIDTPVLRGRRFGEVETKPINLRLGFSAELPTSADPIAYQAFYEAAARQLASAIDRVLLNGTSGGGPTYAGPDWFPEGALNGLRASIPQNSRARVDAGGGPPAVSFFLKALEALPPERSVDTGNLLWIAHGNVVAALLDDMDSVARLISIPVLKTDTLPLTDQYGRVLPTRYENTYGLALLVYRPAWLIVRRSKVSIGVVNDWLTESRQLHVRIRMGLAHDGLAAAEVYHQRWW